MHRSLQVTAVFTATLLCLGLCSASTPTEPNIVDTILKQKDSFFYLDAHAYPKQQEGLPVGIFDSGTGGLTVLNAIVQFDQFNNDTLTWSRQGDGQRDFQGESFIYLGDQANMPYGNYSVEGNTDLLREHILKDAQFLLGRRYYRSSDASACRTDKQPVKALVIACNTATAYGKQDVEAFMQRSGLNLKVIGVIDAGVRSALGLLRKDEHGCIGIMATAGTVASGGYVRTLEAMKNALNYQGDITAVQQAGIGLAGAIDGSPDYVAPQANGPRARYQGPSEGDVRTKIDMSLLQRYGFDWTRGHMLFAGTQQRPVNIQLNSVENYIAYHLVSLMEKVRQQPQARQLKAIILGCTHYPFHRQAFRKKLESLYNYREHGKYIYRPCMAQSIALVDPALNTAKELFEYLVQARLINNADLSQSEFYISVPNQQNTDIVANAAGRFTYAYKYGRRAAVIQEYVKRVPFSQRTITPEVIQRLSHETPLILELISHFNNTNAKTNFLPAGQRIGASLP